MDDDINIDNKNKKEDSTGTDTKKKMPILKSKLPVFKYDFLLKKIIYMSNNNNNE